MQLSLNILLSFSLYLLLATSFTLTYYPTRFFHIAHAATITLGAYFSYLFAIQFGVAEIVAIPAGIVSAVVLGVLSELLVYKHLRKRKAAPLSYLIASIGIYAVLQNGISLVWGDDTKVLNTAEVTVGHNIAGAYVTTVQLITIGVSALLFAGIVLFTRYTGLGKAIRAVSTNPELAKIYGINANRVILYCFIIGSALAAVAGILSAYDTNMTPTMGFNLLLYGVIAMIIGGVGSYWGLAGGALLLATAQHLGAYYIDTKWMEAIAYIILIIFLIWKPLGFSGNKLRKVEI